MIKCLHFNARSIKNKLCELQFTIYSFNAPCVIFICESWLNDSVTNAMIDPHNSFNIFRRDRTEKGGGGVLILVNCNLKTASIDYLNKFSHIECIGFDLLVGSKYRFLLFYRAPGNSHDDHIIMN